MKPQHGGSSPPARRGREGAFQVAVRLCRSCPGNGHATHRVRRECLKAAPALDPPRHLCNSSPTLVLFQPDTFCAKSACQSRATMQHSHVTFHPISIAMARAYKPKTHLDKLNYSPLVNPLMEPQVVKTKRRLVKSGITQDLTNAVTGEVAGVSAIHQYEERDDAEFVKIFASGVAASYDLSKTGQRVFQVVLEQYQKTPMTRGFAESVDLFWFNDGIDGCSVGMSQDTFKKGLRELLDKGFLYPKTPTSYWTNPALFFKGDRVLFIKEYRRKRSSSNMTSELESQGQQRLLD